MRIAKLKIENFKGVAQAELDFQTSHVLLVGANNVGKSTVCEALELALGVERPQKTPPLEEWDFYNAQYLDSEGSPRPIRIEVLLIDVTSTIEKLAMPHLERWHSKEHRLLSVGEIDKVDAADTVWALRLLTIGRYDREEDDFEVHTHYAGIYDLENEDDSRVPRAVRKSAGFLYLRALRTGNRALSLERGSLLDIILRLQTLHSGIWEEVRDRLRGLDPPISEATPTLQPVLRSIERRLGDYIPVATTGSASSIFVSQLTREHLRKTLAFFLATSEAQTMVPFQRAGTGTLNTLVLALLSFIADLKQENIIFAMEEPEIALPPHTQRRIAKYLLTKTTQSFVTSHSPYVIECFKPDQVVVLQRDSTGNVSGTEIPVRVSMKGKTYQRFVRRAIAEAMLGRGVILVEGLTEQPVLEVSATKLEAADPSKYPFDLAGVTILSVAGDGSVAEFCRFFAAMGLPVFGLLDKKKRSQKEADALQAAGFAKLVQTSYTGIEELIASEVDVGIQWSYLSGIRDSGDMAGFIPTMRPADDQLKRLTMTVLKSSKGEGRAADLLELCAVNELPVTLTTFLESVYDAFPRPTSDLASDMSPFGNGDVPE